MAGKSDIREGSIDWGMVEADFLSTPGMSLQDCASKYDIHYVTITKHGGAKAGNWIQRRDNRLKSIAIGNEERMAEILAQDRADDVTALKEIQFRMQRAAVSLLETLFPPADSPVEVQMAAQNRLAEMSGRQLIAAATDCARALTDTGRHLRLLSGKATAIFARAEAPDVYIQDSPELAQARELQARLAQSALLAAADGSVIDIEGVLVSPVSPDPVGVSPDSPMSLNAQDNGPVSGCVTSPPGAGGNGDGSDVGL